MQWTTIVWIVIAILAIFVMARGCGGMMGGMRGGGCGMPRHRDTEEKDENAQKPGRDKAA